MFRPDCSDGSDETGCEEAVVEAHKMEEDVIIIVSCLGGGIIILAAVILSLGEQKKK